MESGLNRRKFLAGSAISSAALLLGCRELNANKKKQSQWLKALVVKDATEEFMVKIKAAGFDGIEAVNPTPAQAEEIRKTAEKTGLRVHSVMFGGASFNSPVFASVNATLKNH